MPELVRPTNRARERSAERRARAARTEAAVREATGELRSLRFADESVERAFLADYFRRSVVPARQFVAMAALFYCAFGVIDGYAYPELQPYFRIYRFGVVAPLALGVLLLSASRHAARLMGPALLLFGMVTCCGLILLAVGTHPAIRHQCFALLVSSFMYLNLLLKLRFGASAALTLAILLGFPAVALAAGFQGPTEIALDVSILACPALFGVILSYTAERHSRADFLQRRIIDERTGRLAEALREVEARRLEAEAAARVDPLTALYNRRHFFSAAEGVALAPDAPRRPISVIILDVDHFKAVNDTYGHFAGDLVLQAVARHIREGVRPGDVACRYGGEEFAVLLPGADLLIAATIGERLRASISKMTVPTEKGPVAVSVSVGVAVASEGPPPIDLLIDRADQALYQAKRNGRNNVRVWRPDGPLVALR